MAWIDTRIPPEHAAALAPLFAAHVDPESGQVDNILAVHALHPAGLEAHRKGRRPQPKGLMSSLARRPDRAAGDGIVWGFQGRSGLAVEEPTARELRGESCAPRELSRPLQPISRSTPR